MQRSHALLHEEIVTAVYNMAAVDFKSFYDTFLRHFLQTAAGVVDSQQTTVLLAVFHAEQASLSKDSFAPPVNRIFWAMMIVWKLRGKIIRTALTAVCCVVYDSRAQ